MHETTIFFKEPSLVEEIKLKTRVHFSKEELIERFSLNGDLIVSITFHGKKEADDERLG